MQHYNPFIYLIVVLISSFLMGSCQSIIRKEPCIDRPGSESSALELIASIRSKNDASKSIKGIGRISLWDSIGVQNTRAAWAGDTDGRFRIEMLGLPGQPVAKFIFDGKEYIFVSTLDQRTYRKSGDVNDLGALTGIAVPTGDIIKILSNVIPLASFDEAIFQNGEPYCRNIMVLKRKWHGVVEKLFLNETHDRVVKVEMYRWGRLVYRAEMGNLQLVEGQEIPFQIVFTNADRNGFSIEVEKCWPDIEIGADMFLIDPVDGR